MTNITTSPIAEKIYRAWEKECEAEPQRTYLGGSEIGHECEKLLWLKFRGAITEKFPGRMYRLFNRGQREEEIFVQDLHRIGCDVKDRDANGNQFAVSAFGGHFAGHLDAIAQGIPEAPKTWHVVEMKTHNEASFKKLVKEGVEKAKPMHYAQMQVYMGLSQAERALYLAVNKNTDELYAERVRFNKTHFELLMQKAKRIIDTCTPDKCATRADDYRCKGCPAHHHCWGKKETLIDPYLELDCRKCCHATAITNTEGKSWSCRLGHSCSTVKKNCEDFLILPIFVDAEPIDATETTITYKSGDIVFTLGKGGKYFTAQELTKVKIDELPPIIMIKETLPESKVVGSNRLEKKYENELEMFKGTVAELRGYLKSISLVDFSKPIATEEIDSKEYFEYPCDYLLIVDKKNDVGIVKSIEAPF